LSLAESKFSTRETRILTHALNAIVDEKDFYNLEDAIENKEADAL